MTSILPYIIIIIYNTFCEYYRKINPFLPANVLCLIHFQNKGGNSQCEGM